MCGEKFRAYAKIWNEWGSPPHVRGKGDCVLQLFDRDGITPACAGKRGSTISTFSSVRDHPRICGEKEAFSPAEIRYWGSPPRMRGKAFLTECRSAGVGITPAHAGKRPLRPSGDTRGWDHPRVCGEKHYRDHNWSYQGGSPPHMRGKDPVLYLRQCLQVRPDHARHLVHLSSLRA